MEGVNFLSHCSLDHLQERLLSPTRTDFESLSDFSSRSKLLISQALLVLKAPIHQKPYKGVLEGEQLALPGNLEFLVESRWCREV